jgi:hypothetical protein
MNLMRQIDTEVKPQWDQIKNGKKYDEFKEDCPPTMLKGWTDDNPSIWEVDHPDKPDLQKILIALCRRKKDWDKITYLLFNQSVVDSAGLTITQTNGNTGDVKIDMSKTHYEIKGLSAKQLCTLIYHIMISPFEVGLFKRSEFEKILLNAYDSSQFSITPKTETMSINPTSMIATTDTSIKDSINTEVNIDKVFKPVSSESFESINIESSSITSKISR